MDCLRGKLRLIGDDPLGDTASAERWGVLTIGTGLGNACFVTHAATTAERHASS